MKLLIIVLVLLMFLSGCTIYRGVVTSPDGKKYIVEQNRPGNITVEDKDIKISADTQSESRIDKLLDYLMMREIRTVE